MRWLRSWTTRHSPRSSIGSTVAVPGRIELLTTLFDYKNGVAAGNTAHFETERAVFHRDHPTDTPPPPRIHLEDVHVEFTGRQGNRTVLQDINLSIHAGEFVCLVGPSGCGKSTLLNLIAGLLPATRGRVYKDGVPLRGAGPDRAVIFQEAALFPWLTAAQNVEFALKSIKNRNERRARAREHLQSVHLVRFADYRPHELSGGMRHRVAIARALALEPDVLLMDEPFAALDAQTRDLLLVEVQRIWLETGKTVVFVTHNIQEAVTLGDRVVCMGVRPGCIKQDILVKLDHPRREDSADVAWIAQQVRSHLREEIAKIVQEESDYAERHPPRRREAPAADTLDAGPGVMGDGI